MAFALMVGPAKADFNRTHATNPMWPPHARFHVVWQVLMQMGVSLVVLALIWRDSADYVFHLAALVRHSKQNADEVFRANVDSTRHMVRLCAKKNARIVLGG